MSTLRLAWNVHASAVWLLSLWGAAAAMAADETQGLRGPVTLAVEDDWAPYAALGKDRSRPVGFAVDVVAAAFATQNIDVRFIVVPFARCMHYARIGRVAGCFNATIVEGNRDFYYWHTTPLFMEELAIYGPTSQRRDDLALADMEGKSVGYTIGYTYPTSFLQSTRFRRVAVKSDRVSLEMLAAGRLQYALLNTMPAQLRLDASSDLKARVRRVGRVRIDGFWVAFSKRHPDGERLSRILESGLGSLHASGAYAQLMQQLPRPQPSGALQHP